MSNYIHSTAIVHPNVELGDNNWIGPFCIIGGAPEYPNRHPDQPHGKVIIGNGNILHGHITIDAATEDELTIIGNDNTFMKGSHVGHNAIIHDNCTLSCGAKIGGFSVINNYCTIGLNATLHQRTILSEGMMIGANSFIKGFDFLPFTVYAGVPARFIKANHYLIDKLKNK